MNNTNPASWGAGACPGAGGPKEPVLGLLTIIEPGIPMLATGGEHSLDINYCDTWGTKPIHSVFSSTF